MISFRCVREEGRGYRLGCALVRGVRSFAIAVGGRGRARYYSGWQRRSHRGHVSHRLVLRRVFFLVGLADAVQLRVKVRHVFGPVCAGTVVGKLGAQRLVVGRGE